MYTVDILLFISSEHAHTGSSIKALSRVEQCDLSQGDGEEWGKYIEKLLSFSLCVCKKISDSILSGQSLQGETEKPLWKSLKSASVFSAQNYSHRWFRKVMKLRLHDSVELFAPLNSSQWLSALSQLWGWNNSTSTAFPPRAKWQTGQRMGLHYSELKKDRFNSLALNTIAFAWTTGPQVLLWSFLSLLLQQFLIIKHFSFTHLAYILEGKT